MNTSFHHMLMKCHLALQREVMCGAKELGLTSGQPKILEYLTENDGAEQKSIAVHCEIERATVGSILNRMETAGLIERRRKGGNRRSLFVYLTENGKRRAEEMKHIFTAAEDRALASLSAQEQDTLRGLLAKIYNTISEGNK